MLITFVPTGENVEVGPLAATPQALASISVNPINVETPQGTTPIQGSMAAGSSSFAPIVGSANGNFIGFFAGANRTLLVTKFKMDDASAVTTGLATISAAIATGDDALYLGSDGQAGS